jgi:hypothetical protein
MFAARHLITAAAPMANLNNSQIPSTGHNPQFVKTTRIYLYVLGCPESIIIAALQ